MFYYDYKCRCGKTYETKMPMFLPAICSYYCECGELLQRVYAPLPVTWHDNCKTWDKNGLGDNLILSHH